MDLIAEFKKRTAVKNLVILNVIFFLLQLVLGDKFTASLMLVSADVFTRPWILVTHMFLHGGFAHILFNMYALWIFGNFLESKIGKTRFYYLYFISGIVAGFVSSFFYTASLGASGAVMGILATLIVLIPNMKVLFFFAIPMPFWVAGIVWVLLDIGGIFFPSGIGNIAHLVGMAIGLGFGFYLKQQRKSIKRTFHKKQQHWDQNDINDYISNGRL